MKRFALLALLVLPVLAAAQEVGSYPNATTPLLGTERILADQSASYPCINCTVNITPAQLLTYFTSGSFTLGHCVDVASASPLQFGDAGSACGSGGSMVYPAAGIPQSTGSAWGTSTIPGTGVLAALAVNVGTAGSIVVNGGAGGTPSSINLANGTGLPVSGLSGLGSDVATWLGTPTLGNLNLALGVTIPSLSGTITASQCAYWVSTTTLGSQACGSGSSAFSAITGGTNTAAAMLVGTGASLAPTGTGIINANQLNGAAVPTSASCLGSNSSGVLVSCTTTSIQVNGTNILASPPNFTNSAATNGLTITFTNASGGTIQLGLSGLPAMVANECLGANSGATAFTYFACSGGSGSGTVNSGTSGQVAYYATTGTAVSGETTITAAQSAAISGDVTKAAGAASATVTGINGASIPTSTTVAATNSSGQIIAASTVTYLIDTGTQYTIAGTGACATITKTGTTGTAVGEFKCTGTTGASTITITLPAATNGWSCSAHDVTTIANTLAEGAGSTTTDTFSGTVNANDFVKFQCMGF